MKYLSLFSGVGGFEHPTISPSLLCEKDEACLRVLKRKYPQSEICEDINDLSPPSADFVIGGWPCQDISTAGAQVGIDGNRSGLFFRMVEVAKMSGAHTIVGENVPNVLLVNRGMDFQKIIHTLVSCGFPFISWRTLNARQFGLPQERRRVFIIASAHREIAVSIHSALECDKSFPLIEEPSSAGFYWTAGGRSICYSLGYVPTLKVGASGSKGRSVVAVFSQNTVRKLSAETCLRLQGLDTTFFKEESKTDIVRMAGNAVTVPVGQFVIQNAFSSPRTNLRYRGTGMPIAFSKFSDCGFYENEVVWEVSHSETTLARNLDGFIGGDLGEELSGQAAAGLIVRCYRAGKGMPLGLFDTLVRMSHNRQSYRGSRSNSFYALDEIDLGEYRKLLAQESSQDSKLVANNQQSLLF